MSDNPFRLSKAKVHGNRNGIPDSPDAVFSSLEEESTHGGGRGQRDRGGTRTVRRHSPDECRPSAQAFTRWSSARTTTVDLLLTCALTGSHALLVGVPGLAKTLMVKALASAFHWKSRASSSRPT